MGQGHRCGSCSHWNSQMRSPSRDLLHYITTDSPNLLHLVPLPLDFPKAVNKCNLLPRSIDLSHYISIVQLSLPAFPSNAQGPRLTKFEKQFQLPTPHFSKLSYPSDHPHIMKLQEAEPAEKQGLCHLFFGSALW